MFAGFGSALAMPGMNVLRNSIEQKNL